MVVGVMELPATAGEVRGVVQEEYFDHRVVPKLVDYLITQVSTSTYDFTANKALLKLYQFFPDLMQEDVVARILYKALMNLPENDLRALLCIAPEAALKMASVVAIKRAADALETADYAAFWALTKQKDLVEICLTVPDFEDQIRRFICGALAYSCRDLPRPFVENCLSLSGRDLDSFLKGGSDISSITNDRVYFSQNSFNIKTVHSHKYSAPDISRVLRATAN
eukprot:30795_1